MSTFKKASVLLAILLLASFALPSIPQTQAVSVTSEQSSQMASIASALDSLKNIFQDILSKYKNFLTAEVGSVLPA